MSGAVLVLAESLAILALLAFAVSVVVFLIQTSWHRPARAWSLAAGASLVLLLVFGTLSNAISRQSAQTLSGEQSRASKAIGPENYEATVKVTRVVDGDTIDISPSVRGRSRVRLIGMDTPEVYFGTQPYGSEASVFAKQQLEGKEVGLALDVQKVDPYRWLLAHIYLQNREMLDHSFGSYVAQRRLPVEIRRSSAMIHVRELATTYDLVTQASREARLNGRKVRTDGRREE
jgi:endonuclease YncB( thermonuclease family)